MKRRIIALIIAAITMLQCVGVMAYTDSEAINLLSFSDLSFETPEAVTLDLALPSEYKGKTVMWSSTNTSVISVTGKVTRPAVGESAETVTITATMGSNSKSFEVKVMPFESAADVITLAKAKLTFDKLSAEKIGGVTQALSLPSSDEYGTVIRWESSDNRVLRIVPDGANYKGEISRASFSDGNFSVFLTASMYYGDAFAKTRFYLTVTELDVSYSYSTILSGVVEEFDSAFKLYNNIQALRKDLVLPEITGATVTYTSSAPETIATDGTVTRGVVGDKLVYYTATIDNGYENTHITYSIIVKPIGETETIERLEEDLEWVVAQVSSSNLAAITGNMTLPKTAPNGSSVEYTSSNPTVLGNDGTVNRQTSDTDILLNVKVYFADESRDTTLTIRVKKKTEQGSTEQGVGGNTSPAPPSTTPAPTEKPKYRYTDVTPSHWAYTAIENLSNRGVVDGNDDGTFGPDNSITREAFVKMLVTAMNTELKTVEVPFNDVSRDAWYYKYVSTAVEKGIVNGIEDDIFGVGRNITRQDICTLIYRAFYANETADDANCADYASVSDYAKTAVSVMYKHGILEGDDDGNFNPQSNATRAEVSAIFYRLLNK